MPMTESFMQAKVHQLSIAHDSVKEIFTGKRAINEIHSDTEIAQNWSVITASYSGLEQTLKYLLAEQKKLSIDDLLNVKNQSRKSPYRTHNLAFLYSQLNGETKEIIEEYYCRFQSLCDYIHVERANQFLDRVSDSDGRGYERWRYALIEDKALPKNSPEVLLAIWGVCVQIAESRLWDDQKVQMPDKELTCHLRDILEKIEYSAPVVPSDADESSHDISKEMEQWLLSQKHPLNAFASALWHDTRYGTHGVTGTSKWLSDIIMEWIRQVLECDAVKARTPLRAFVNRSQGFFPGGESIRWNTKTHRFENIPWSLSEIVQDDKPENATEFNDIHNSHGYPLKIQRLRKAAKECGYQVSENMSFDRLPKAKDIWSCILQITENRNGEIKPVLSIWRKHRHASRHSRRHGVFCMVKEGTLDEMEPPIRRWIDHTEILKRHTEDEDTGTIDDWQPA